MAAITASTVGQRQAGPSKAARTAAVTTSVRAAGLARRALRVALVAGADLVLTTFVALTVVPQLMAGVGASMGITTATTELPRMAIWIGATGFLVAIGAAATWRAMKFMWAISARLEGKKATR